MKSTSATSLRIKLCNPHSPTTRGAASELNLDGRTSPTGDSEADKASELYNDVN
jgi:hypothetical protein